MALACLRPHLNRLFTNFSKAMMPPKAKPMSSSNLEQLRWLTSNTPSNNISLQYIRQYSCNSCKPPKKQSKCKPKIKECNHQCPLDHDLPKPPSPMPGRPPQPDKCKDKFKVKKLRHCQPCPPPWMNPCDKHEGKACDE